MFADLGAKIDRETAGNEIRAAALAALTANESGGTAEADRFSPPQMEVLSRTLANKASGDRPVSTKALRIWL